MSRPFFALVALALSSSAWSQTEIDRAVGEALKTFNVPGIAVGVMQNGHIELAKGYGIRKLGTTDPVTEKTLFQIASNTKAFTSAALAILIDEKKLSWDDRVVDVLPEFQMSDPFVTREMRIRDLLCHRSGLALGAGDLLFFPDATVTTAEFMHHLRFVPIANSLRSRYEYDNVLYTVAGQVIEKVSGKPWASFVQERIFTPLGMTGSRTSAQALKPADEYASSHALNGDKLQVVGQAALGAAAPAGSLNSSVEDLLKWANLQLNHGAYAGGRLFSEEQSDQMWTPHIFIPVARSYPPELAALRPNFQAYGLGWVLTDYHGERLVWHTGGLAGMVTRFTLVPEKKLAVVVLTNGESGDAFNSVTLSILDKYLEAKETNWVAAFKTVHDRHLAEARKSVSEAAGKRAANSKPSLPLEKYAGRYRDAWYGDVSITKSGDSLAMKFSHSPRLTGKLEHFQYDTFIVRWNDRTFDADAYVTFSLNPDGSIRDVKMKAISSTTDFSFDFHDLDLKPIGPNVPPF